jgi:hypothetical protein
MGCGLGPCFTMLHLCFTPLKHAQTHVVIDLLLLCFMCFTRMDIIIPVSCTD